MGIKYLVYALKNYYTLLCAYIKTYDVYYKYKHLHNIYVYV